jgi:site-specific DNA-cytosine methylase
VRGLLWNDKENKKDKYGRTWNTIWTALQGLEEYGYYVRWKILNTRDYGIPQNRERVFMMGKLGGDFHWPASTEMDNIRDYVDWEYKYKSQKHPPPRIAHYISTRHRNAIFIDGSFPRNTQPNASRCCSCIIAGSKIWCVPLGRWATLGELQRLQGFKNFALATSSFQFKKQIGNSMSVNVISAIFNELL